MRGVQHRRHAGGRAGRKNGSRSSPLDNLLFSTTAKDPGANGKKNYLIKLDVEGGKIGKPSRAAPRLLQGDSVLAV